jgi:hypothetical protein
MTRVLARVEAVFPHLVRVTIPSWEPDIPVYVLRQSMPPEVEAKLLRGGYVFVDADLDARTPQELVVSLRGWKWSREV